VRPAARLAVAGAVVLAVAGLAYLRGGRAPARCVCGQSATGLIDGRPVCADELAGRVNVRVAGHAGTATRQAGTCGSCLRRPSVTDRAGWPLCRRCAGLVDAATRHAREVADALSAKTMDQWLAQAHGGLVIDTQPGTTDMSEFEEDPG
jgi:hypothetical protein